jgi:3-oxoacyl-[acyl-carrier protein] reductase
VELSLRDRVILVAGASRGIGLGIARACLTEGAKVAMVARGADALDAARSALCKVYGESRVWACCGDLRQSAVIDETIARVERELGPLWGTVANVGLQSGNRGFDVDDETWEPGFEQNLHSSYRLARAALSRMTERQAGSFVFISSISGISAFGGPLTYGASKAAINQLTKELARLVASRGVRVNAIAPGPICFPGGEWEKRLAGPRADE